MRPTLAPAGRLAGLVITGARSFSPTENDVGPCESVTGSGWVVRERLTARSRVAPPMPSAPSFSPEPRSPRLGDGLSVEFTGPSTTGPSVITRYHPPALTLLVGSENGGTRRYA